MRRVDPSSAREGLRRRIYLLARELYGPGTLELKAMGGGPNKRVVLVIGGDAYLTGLGPEHLALPRIEQLLKALLGRRREQTG